MPSVLKVMTMITYAHYIARVDIQSSIRRTRIQTVKRPNIPIELHTHSVRNSPKPTTIRNTPSSVNYYYFLSIRSCMYNYSPHLGQYVLLSVLGVLMHQYILLSTRDDVLVDQYVLLSVLGVLIHQYILLSNRDDVLVTDRQSSI